MYKLIFIIFLISFIIKITVSSNECILDMYDNDKKCIFQEYDNIHTLIDIIQSSSSSSSSYYISQQWSIPDTQGNYY